MNQLPEPFQIPAKKTFSIALSLLLIIGVILLALILWLRHWPKETPHETAPPVSARHQVEFESGLLLQEYKQQQTNELNSYSWQDAQHQFAKVPIEHAIEALSETHNETVSEESSKGAAK
jgi:hypothetical protein